MAGGVEVMKQGGFESTFDSSARDGGERREWWWSKLMPIEPDVGCGKQRPDGPLSLARGEEGGATFFLASRAASCRRHATVLDPAAEKQGRACCFVLLSVFWTST